MIGKKNQRELTLQPWMCFLYMYEYGTLKLAEVVLRRGRGRGK
jgi:hypothetical protein